jgi:predicted nuclease with TOPRIM domain
MNDLQQNLAELDVVIKEMSNTNVRAGLKPTIHIAWTKRLQELASEIKEQVSELDKTAKSNAVRNFVTETVNASEHEKRGPGRPKTKVT